MTKTQLKDNHLQNGVARKVTQRTLPPIDLSVAKDMERMKLRDGTITPDMVRYLNSVEVVEALLNQG